jgi:ligand-binding sensor domain-containing protein
MTCQRYICLLLLLVSGFAYGQGSPFVFHHLNEQNGLSNNIVNCFLRDSRGFLWVGTFAGLNRFDGTHFYVYKNTKDPHSILNNSVHDLCEDRKGNIWGATENGIFCFYPQKGIFKNYITPKSKVATTVPNTARGVFNVLADKGGNIWATSLLSILRLNPETDTFEDVGPITPDPDSIYRYSVRKNGFLEDPSGNGLWMATSMGLHFYNFKTKTFSGARNSSDSLFTQRSVSALFFNTSGQGWFCDNLNKHVVAFDPVSRRVTKRIDISKNLPDAFGGTLFEDASHRLWLSTWNDGIVMIDYQKSANVTRIKNDKSDALSIAADFMWSVTEDKDGTLWMGTINGISKCNITKAVYRVHRLSESVSVLQNSPIKTITEDAADKSWWIVNGASDIVHYRPARGQSFVYTLSKALKNRNGKLPGELYALYLVDGSPLLCTQNGLWKIDPGSHAILPHVLSSAIDPQFEAKELAFHDGVYYLSNGNELVKYDSRNSKLFRIKHSTDKLKDGQKPSITHLCVAPNGQLWFVSAYGWIGYLDQNNKLVPVYLIQEEDKEMNGYFNSLYADQKGKLWLAQKGVGLYRYDPAKRSVKYWNEANGLLFNHILRTAADNDGHIWCAAYNKISVFAPTTESFYNLTLPLGENNLVYTNWLTVLSNGNVVSSLRGDVVEFFPKHLTFTPKIQKPLIGIVNISGKEVLPVEGEGIQLEPEEKALTVKFGLPTDPGTFPFSFSYKLEGFDDDWTKTDVYNQAVYNHLPPGNYTFRLVAKDKNGRWTSPETALNIHIKTLFIQSLLFYALVGFFVSGLLYTFYRFRTSKQTQLYALQTKAQALEKEKTLVMYESLKQQLNPHFLFNSLTSLSSLIKVDQKLAGQFLDGMSKIYRYILKSRDHEVVSLGEEVKFVENYIRLQKTRFETGFQVTINVPEEEYYRRIAPVTLQNLIENAIKHNIIDDESPLVIEIFVEDDYLITRNNLQRKRFVDTSNKQGLANLKSLYKYLTRQPIIIDESNDHFTIKIPLI